MSVAMLSVSATACGAEVGAQSEPRAVISEMPEIDCNGGDAMSTSGGLRVGLKPDAEPVTPREAMAAHLRHNVGGLAVDDLIEVGDEQGIRGYAFELDGRVIATFGLGRDGQVWYVGPWQMCADDGRRYFGSRAEVDCTKAEGSVDDSSHRRGFEQEVRLASPEAALDAYLEAHSTWLRRAEVTELERQRLDPNSRYDVTVRYIYEQDGRTVARFIVAGLTPEGDTPSWWVEEAEACGPDIIDRPGTVGDELECAGGVGGYFTTMSSDEPSASSAVTALEHSLSARGSAVGVGDLEEIPARILEGVSFRYQKGGRTLAIFDLATPFGKQPWRLMLDEWCAEVDDLFAHR